jgi:hypothetical protein
MNDIGVLLKPFVDNGWNININATRCGFITLATKPGVTHSSGMCQTIEGSINMLIESIQKYENKT